MTGISVFGMLIGSKEPRPKASGKAVPTGVSDRTGISAFATDCCDFGYGQAAKSVVVLGDNLASSTKSSAPSCSTA
jgi:hypothetical protein